jgi:S-layer homology domain
MTEPRRSRQTVRIAVAGAALASALVSAAPVTAQGAAQEFGPVDATVTTLMASSFGRQSSADSYDEDVDGWRNATGFVGPVALFRAGLDVPTGGRLTAFELEACDTDATSDVSARLLECGSGPSLVCAPISGAAVITTSAAGCARFLSTNVNHTVDNRLFSYMVEVVDPSIDPATRFRSVRVSWKRQVSPPPAQATFADVPPSHFAFRYVEALSRAGITGGCAPTQYCPDAAVSRAQMAVFLVVALGLHWPN